MVGAFQTYEMMVMETRRNIQRATYQQGPYRLTKRMQKHETTIAEWLQMTPAERSQKLLKIDESSRNNPTAALFQDPVAVPVRSQPMPTEADAPEMSFETISSSTMSSRRQDIQTTQKEAKSIRQLQSSKAAPVFSEILGDFSKSGLPPSSFGSWTNAGKIIEQGGIGPCPGKENSRVVISLSGTGLHEVKISWAGGLSLACDAKCPMYTMRKICAHTLAVAHGLDHLESYLLRCKPTFQSIIQSSIPLYAGRKDNEKQKGKARSQKKQARDISTFNDPFSLSPSVAATAREQEIEKFELVFITDTSAYKCHGCSAQVRENGNSDPPAAPFDVFIRRKEFRSFRPRGSRGAGIVRISTKPEYVYYHPLKSCVPKGGLDQKENFFVTDRVERLLSDVHCQLLWREFGLNLDD